MSRSFRVHMLVMLPLLLAVLCIAMQSKTADAATLGVRGQQIHFVCDAGLGLVFGPSQSAITISGNNQNGNFAVWHGEITIDRIPLTSSATTTGWWWSGAVTINWFDYHTNTTKTLNSSVVGFNPVWDTQTITC